VANLETVHDMNSKAIQNAIHDWALDKGFNAPYGVLTGEHVKKNKKVLSVVFGRARSLDAVVEIWNRNFMTLRTNQYPWNIHKGYYPKEIYRSFDALMEKLETL